MSNTIIIYGTQYSIQESVNKVNGDRAYILTGKRGATYKTMRNVNDPTKMFLYNMRNPSSGKMESVWLTDVNGKLEVYQA